MKELCSLTEQRYSHVIVFGPSVQWRADDLLNVIGDIHPGQFSDEEYAWGVIKYRTMYSTKQYATDLIRAQPMTEDGEKFIYDIFAMEMEMKSGICIALGLPYSAIGRSLNTSLRASKLLHTADFLRVKIDRLIEAVREGEKGIARFLVPRIEVRLDGYPDVSGFSLSGDNVIFSQIYMEIMREVMNSNRKSDVDADEHKDEKGGKPPQIGDLGEGKKATTTIGFSYTKCSVRVLASSVGSLSIHCDLFGNYRMWLRKEAKNLRIFHEFLVALQSIEAIDYSSTYPSLRGKED